MDFPSVSFQFAVMTNQRARQLVAFLGSTTEDGSSYKITVSAERLVSQILHTSQFLGHISSRRQLVRLRILLFKIFLLLIAMVIAHDPTHGFGTAQFVKIVEYDCLGSLFQGS